MSNGDKPEPVRSAAGALRQPRYEPGNYLTASDLSTEQLYLLQRLRHHHRYLHGWGVVCGLWVVPLNNPLQPWGVQVCPGLALDPCGAEIEVRRPAPVDLHDHVWKKPREHQIKPAYVAIRYTEEPSRSVPSHPPQCSCNDPIYRPTRLRDSFKIDVLWGSPSATDKSFAFCLQETAPCPPPPGDLHVILAAVTIPLSEREPITSAHIDNLTFRQSV